MPSNDTHEKVVLEKDLQTNDLGTIHLAPIVENLNFTGQWAYADEASSPLTIINLQGIFDSLPDEDHTLAIDTMIQWHTQAEIDDPAYQAVLEEFVENTYFLTGDLNSGGIFFYKKAIADPIYGLFMGCVYAYMDNNDVPAEYRYYIGRDAQYGFKYEECGAVALAFQEKGFEDYPSFLMFTKDTDPTVYLEYFDPAGTSPRAGIADTLEEVLMNMEYGWTGSKQQRITIAQYPEGESHGGSWSGGGTVDPEYNPYNDDSNPTDEDEPDRHDSDPIEIPDPNESGIDAINSGFITLYNPTKADVIAFNDYMFLTVDDSISQHLKRLISDPYDYLVFIALCHFHPTQSIAQQHILLAGMDSGVSCPVIAQQYIAIDCGTITIFQDNANFTDYSPYSKATIYLPYVGFRDIKIDEIRGGKLHVVYNVDLLTGSFTCFVKVERGYRNYWTEMTSKDYKLEGIILTAEGNCFEMVPLSSTDFRNFFTGLMGAIGGGMSAVAGNVVGGLGAMASSISSMKPTVNRSGNPSGNMGYMGYQTPYLMVTYPFGANPSKMGMFQGYPSNILQSIGSCNNAFVQIDTDTIWMDDIPCMDDEMSEIKQLLNEGVWVNV